MVPSEWQASGGAPRTRKVTGTSLATWVRPPATRKSLMMATLPARAWTTGGALRKRPTNFAGSVVLQEAVKVGLDYIQV